VFVYFLPFLDLPDFFVFLLLPAFLDFLLDFLATFLDFLDFFNPTALETTEAPFLYDLPASFNTSLNIKVGFAAWVDLMCAIHLFIYSLYRKYNYLK